MLHYHEFRAMNTGVLLAAEGERGSLEAAFAQAEASVRGDERRFTRFTETSELAALNRSGGAWFDASDDLYEIVSKARDLFFSTGGLFNPAVIGALEMAGYDRSFDEIRAAESLRVTTAVLPSPVTGFEGIELDPARRRVRLPAGVRLDLGGIAKGWIAERACRLLAQSAAACAVNAGGDQFALGLPAGEDAWAVALEDPADPERTLAVLRVPPGALCTSTTTRRRWTVDGQERHHLIDPRTGESAASSWQSVTAYAPRAADAEALAKVVLIGGRLAAARVLAAFPGAAVIAVDERGGLWVSDGAKGMVG